MSSSEWETYKLEDVLEALIDYRGKTPQKTTSGVPLITAKIVKNGFISDPEEFISEEDYDRWMVRGLPKIGDVILTTEAPLGEVAQLKDDRVALAQRLVTLRGKSGVLDNGFLKYFLQSNIGQSRLKERETGTTVAGIKQSELRLIDIDLPSFSEQCRISSILLALDKKIELNRQTNQTLEAIAQAIYKEWFVNFNYPGATGEMQDSELGPIPKGSSVGSFNNILTIEIGGDWGKDIEFEDSIQAVSLRGTDLEKLKSVGFAQDAPLRWIKKNSIRKRNIDSSDVLIAGSGLGPIGRSLYCDEHLLNIYQYPITYSNFCKRLKSQSPAYAIYAERLFETIYKNGGMRQYFTGTSIPNLDIQSLLNYRIIIPPVELVEEFAHVIGFAKFEKLFNLEGVFLAQIRDILLPKLMSGEIEV
jgi:type I restriction enzyme S subunit